MVTRNHNATLCRRAAAAKTPQDRTRSGKPIRDITSEADVVEKRDDEDTAQLFILLCRPCRANYREAKSATGRLDKIRRG